MKAIYGLVVLLAGCASSPDVLDIGNGRYSVTGYAQRNCPGNSREEAVDSATEFCDRVKKKPIVENFDDKMAQLRCSSSVIFHCE